MSNEKQEAVLASALAYARLKLAVIPVARGSKSPLTAHGYKDGSRDPEVIRRFFTRHCDANVAIVTGKPSHVIVLDVDAERSGFQTLNQLQRNLGPLPRTWTAETGGGGRHLYFEDTGVNVTRDSAGRLLGSGVDVLGDGAYAVAPPSRHASGTTYSWAVGLSPREVQLAILPQAWASHIATKLAQKPLSNKQGPAAQVVDPASIPEGQRNGALTQLAGKLRRDGLQQEAISAALLAHNTTFCKPPLDEAEVEKIAKSVASYPAPVPPGAGSQDPALVIARQLLAAHYADGQHLLYLPGTHFWRFDGKRWIPVAAEVLQSDLLNVIETTQIDGRPPTASLLIQTITLLRAICARDGDPLRLLNDPAPVINCRNGELWLKANGMVELRPHRADSYLRNLINVKYDPKATCPEYDRALRGIFSRSSDPDDMAGHWDELVGYVIQQTRQHALILVLYGTGNNGKSKLMSLVVKLLGEDAVYAGRIEDLEKDRFAVGSMLNKQIFMDDDVRNGAKLPDGALKKFSEGKILTGERKFRDKFNFKNRAVPVLLCNHVPYLSDLSHGMLRRLQVIPFRRKFVDKDDDKKLFDRIAANELSGVLNRAIEGWQRLQKRSQFRLPEDVTRAVKRWLVQANPLEAFIDEECVKVANAATLWAKFYRAFQTYARDSGIRSVPASLTVKRDLQLRGYKFKRRSNGQVVLGIRLRDFGDHDD